MLYVSSYHIVSSLGFSTAENLDKIKNNISGIEVTENSTLSPEPVYVSLFDRDDLEEKIKNIDIEIPYTSYEKLLIYSINEALKTTDVDIEDKETLLIFSTTKGNIDLLQPDKKNQWNYERAKLWKSSELIKMHFNHPNEPITVSNACISGTLAMIVAKRLLDNGNYKHAVVAGADILPEFTLSGFQVFKAVGVGACKPFDINRSGMTPGEGAGTIILTKDSTKAMKPHIYITGGTCGNDANHISGPSKTGEEPSLTINKTLHESGLNSYEIDFISAHGTATVYNDESEAKAFTLSGLNHVPTNSFKGYVGHTFGAAGIIETILSVESLKQNTVFKSIGFDEQGTENILNIITENKEIQVNQVLKTASGFGGSNAALIFGKTNHSKNIKLETEFNIISHVKISDHHLLINKKEEKLELNDINPISNIDFLKQLYRMSKIQYPKFFKMDLLCKTAFIACEYLLKDNETLIKYKGEDIAVILSNGSSSLNTDLEYQNTINDRGNYFPSPAVFVYTLPNIMAGEICIRHKIKGENAVFISDSFNKEFIFDYVKILFETGKAKACIAGRVDHTYPEGNIFSELYLIESNK